MNPNEDKQDLTNVADWMLQRIAAVSRVTFLDSADKLREIKALVAAYEGWKREYGN